jgi:hypothetical protein
MNSEISIELFKPATIGIIGIWVLIQVVTILY